MSKLLADRHINFLFSNHRAGCGAGTNASCLSHCCCICHIGALSTRTITRAYTTTQAQLNQAICVRDLQALLEVGLKSLLAQPYKQPAHQRCCARCCANMLPDVYVGSPQPMSAALFHTHAAHVAGAKVQCIYVSTQACRPVQCVSSCLEGSYLYCKKDNSAFTDTHNLTISASFLHAYVERIVPTSVHKPG
jgi:hypothetical protein